MEDNDNYAKKKDDFPESHLHCEICTLKSVSKKEKKNHSKNKQWKTLHPWGNAVRFEVLFQFCQLIHQLHQSITGIVHQKFPRPIDA
jgi:hypothetical protein